MLDLQSGFPNAKMLGFDDLGVTQFYENITMGIKQRICVFTKKKNADYFAMVPCLSKAASSFLNPFQ